MELSKDIQGRSGLLRQVGAARCVQSSAGWAGNPALHPHRPSGLWHAQLCDVHATSSVPRAWRLLGGSLILSEEAPSLACSWCSCHGVPEQRCSEPQRFPGETGRLPRGCANPGRPQREGEAASGAPLSQKAPPVPRSARRAPTVRDRGRHAAGPRLSGIRSVCGLRGRLFCLERRRRKEEEGKDEEGPEPRRRSHGGRP